MKSKFFAVALLGIIIIGAVLRLYRSEQHFRWGSDQYYDLILWERMTKTFPRGNISSSHPFAGQEGRFIPKHEGSEETGLTVYNGILYTYLFLPVAVITQFDPFSIVLATIFLYLVSIVLIYHTGTLLFDKRVGIIAAYLFALSYWTVDFSRSYWTPSPLPFFVLLSLYALARVMKKQQAYWPLLAFSAGTTSQLHNSGYIFLVYILLLVALKKVPFPHNRLTRLLTLVFFFIPLLPTIFTEFTSNFSLANSLSRSFLYQIERLYSEHNLAEAIFFIAQDILNDSVSFFINAMGVISRVNGTDFWKPYVLALFIVTLVLHIPILFRTRRKFAARETTVLVGWIILTLPLPWIVRVYYDLAVPGFGVGNMIGLIASLPILFLFLSFLLSEVSRRFPFSIASVIFISIYSLVNIAAIYEHIWQNNDAKFNYAAEYNLAKTIERDSQHMPFELMFTYKDQPGSEILYFFERYSLPLPERINGSSVPQGNNPSKIILANNPAHIVYTILATNEREDYIGKDLGKPIGKFYPLVLYKNVFDTPEL